MTITRTPDFFEDTEQGFYSYGIGAPGSLSVSAGSGLTMDTQRAAGPYVVIGRNAGADGLVTVAGNDSRIDVVSGGSATEGMSVSIGRDGGTGTLAVLDGATFAISDPNGADNTAVTDGAEYLWVGRGAGATGLLSVDAATFDYGGTGVLAIVGREEGNGEIRLTNGAFFTMRSTADGAQDFTSLRIGSDDGTGVMAIEDSMALIQAGRQAQAVIEIGSRGGTGTLRIDGTTDAPNRDGLFLTGSAQSSWVGLRLGDDGTGDVEMTGGSLAVANLGRDILPEGGTAAQDGPGGAAALDIGINGGTGRLSADGSQLFVGGHTDAAVQLGNGPGTDGAMALQGGSQLTVQGTNTGALLGVGRHGGQGLLTLIDAGSTITLDGRSDDRSARLEVGSRGAGSEGDAVIASGAAVNVNSTAQDANLLVGVQGGTGRLLLDDASLTLNAARFSNIRIGGVSWPDEEDQSGYGDVVLQNSAQLTAISDAGSSMRIGGGEGSEGTLQMLSGAQIDLGGRGFVGVANPNEGFQGGVGTLALDGAGTRMDGLRTLFAGDGQGVGLIELSDQAQIVLGGLDQALDASLQLGRHAGGDGRMTITHATVTLQAGNGTDAEERGTEAYTAIGFQGGMGRMDITGDALADPRAPVASPGTGARQGFVQFGGSDTPFSTIDIGRGLNGDRGHGTVFLTGGSFGTRNDGAVPGADPEGTGGRGSNIRIGLDNGSGQLEASGGAHVFGIAGNDYSGLEIGRGRAEDGTRNQGTVEIGDGSRLDLASAGHDAWVLVGHEGGQGEMLITGSHAHIAGGRYAGFRIGTHWFTVDEDLESGVGALTLADGATVLVEAGQDATLWVGGGAGAQATADIIGGATLDLDGDVRGFVMVGGMAGFLPGTGGEGTLSVDGAGSALRGVQDMLVGFNAGTGTVQITDGGLIDVAAADDRASGEAFVGVGIGRLLPELPVISGTGTLSVTGPDSQLQIAGPALAALDVGDRGTGSVMVADGGQITLASTGADSGAARLTLGRNGGDGSLTVDGAGSAVSVEGATSGIFMGRSGDTPEGGSGARLTVSNGGRVATNGLLLAGEEDGLSGPVVVALDGGTIAAANIRINAGGVLAGRGTLEGLAGAPFVQMDDATLRPGDRADGMDTLDAGFGTMTISGNVAKADGAVWFDVGALQHDALSIDGVFAMTGGTIHARWLGGEAALNGGIRLIEASGGVVLDSVTHELMSDDHQLELRAEGTELWLLGPGDIPAPPPPLPPGWRDWFDWHDNPATPAPPLPGGGSGAGSRGDPHLLTFDGAAYDFHAAGEYVMSRATDGSGFELQARMAPVAQDASANIAAAVRLDGGAVMVAAGNGAPLFIDGVATDLAAGATRAVGHDFVYRSGDTWHLVHTGDGDTDTGFSAVSVTVLADRVDIAVTLDPALQGLVEGLLGNFDGDPANDIALADGTPLERPLRFDDVYGALRADWRVDSAEQSLFSYAPGEGPDSFYLPDYPTAMIGLDSFDADQIAAAETAVEGAGLAPGTLAFQNAVFDLLLTGDTSYVDSARLSQAQVDNRPEDAAPVEIPQTDGGGLEGLLRLSGQLTGPGGVGLDGGTVTFQPEGRSVNLIRMTGAGGEFAFDLSEGATGQLAAMRAYDTGAGDPMINAGDALDVLRLAVGLSPSFGPAAAQNYVAADINGDGRVGADDALEVLRHAVGLESAHVPRWVFVDADTDWEGLALNANNTAVPSGVMIDDLSADMSIGLTGILLGSMVDLT